MSNPSIKLITDREAEFAWDWLKVYESVPYVMDLLEKKHNVQSKHRRNIRKQAEQIRYCVQQSQEYHAASKSVSLVTKPVLLYYSVMNLALAELLFKQTGQSSLDVAREEHRHHGLLYSECLNQDMRVVDGLRSLRAKPMVNKGVRTGTFELWRHTAAYSTIVSELNFFKSGRNFTSQAISGIGDILPVFPDSGISFFDCVTHLPWLMNLLSLYKIETQIIRGVVAEQRSPAGDKMMKIIVHPGQNQNLVEALMGEFRFDANFHDVIDVHEDGVGGFDLKVNFGKGHFYCHLPEAVQNQLGELYFYPNFPLNEFGAIYVGLFILSNTARYYPDKWMNQIERSTEIVTIVDNFLKTAQDRMALLTLGELSESVYILKK